LLLSDRIVIGQKRRWRVIEWTTIVVVGILTAGLMGLGITGVIALRHIGQAAFQSGAAPKSAESFVNFFLQSARIATVAVIVFSTVILALTGKLTEGAVGILSGVAGYVLGSVSRPRGPESVPDRAKQQ
jgi:hypothetical protein